jgi:hypothetical protein
MKIWMWTLAFCLIVLSVFINAQETCTCSQQLTQMQMQSQVDRDNLNARIDQQSKNFNSSLTQVKLDMQSKIDVDFAQHDQNMVQENNRVIDQVLMRVTVALIATSGFLVSLIILIIYMRW